MVTCSKTPPISGMIRKQITLRVLSVFRQFGVQAHAWVNSFTRCPNQWPPLSLGFSVIQCSHWKQGDLNLCFVEGKWETAPFATKPPIQTPTGRQLKTLEPPAQSADIVLSLFSFFLSPLSSSCVLPSSVPPFAPHFSHPPKPPSPQSPYLCLSLSLSLSPSLSVSKDFC